MCCREDSVSFDLTIEVENVECVLKTLSIDKKQCKKVHTTNNKLVSNNPFYKLKHLKKNKRNISITCALPQCKDVVINKQASLEKISKEKDSKLISDITEKMAKIWNEHGYRDMDNNKILKTPQSNLDPSVNISQNETSNGENNENFTQVSSQTCARQAMYDYCDSSVTELAAYLDETLFIPKKMSFMAEMMYT